MNFKWQRLNQNRSKTSQSKSRRRKAIRQHFSAFPFADNYAPEEHSGN
jgi:hypothetical protein